MRAMAKPLTADDIVPLVNALTPKERGRLLRMITRPHSGDDASAYSSMPPGHDEFSADEEPLAWEADGWEDVA